MKLTINDLTIQISGDLNEHFLSCPDQDVVLLKQQYNKQIQVVIIDDMLKRADTVVFDMFKPYKKTYL